MNIVLVGAVNSSLNTLEKLLQHGVVPSAVFGYQSEDTSHISGYEDLEPKATQAGIDFHGFIRINECYEKLKTYEPDMILVVGLSQLVSEEIIGLPKHGCVGFHPTALPLGRGRAPLAWILLDDCPAAATFFRIGKGADDGPIYVQKRVDVKKHDDVSSLTRKILSASDAALDEWLPLLKKNVIEAREQDHSKATYYGKRTEKDGRISLAESTESICRLVRATSHPYPGAYLLYGDLKVRVWKAEISLSSTTAVPGSIVDIAQDGSFKIQTVRGYIRIVEFSSDDSKWTPKEGMRFNVFSGLTWPIH